MDGIGACFLRSPNRRSLLGPTWLSVAAHAAAGALFLFSLRLHPVHVFRLPGTELGARLEHRIPAGPGAGARASSAEEGQTAAAVRAGNYDRSDTSGLYATTGRGPSAAATPPYRDRGCTLAKYHRARVRYAGLDYRFRLLGFRLDPDSSHFPLSPPRRPISRYSPMGCRGT